MNFVSIDDTILCYTCLLCSDGPKSVVVKKPPLGQTAHPPLASKIVQPSTGDSPSLAAAGRGSAIPTEGIKLPPGAPAEAVKPTTGFSIPLGAKPMVVPGKPAPLQPVGRGAAAAFADKDDEEGEDMEPSGEGRSRPSWVSA